MQLLIDKTGFPLVDMENLQVSLWPVAKVQFERFLAEHIDFPGGETDKNSWYENILRMSPRISYKEINQNNYERFFMSGVRPNEALSFANWMGEGFDLPSVVEWRYVFKKFQDLRYNEIKDSLKDLKLLKPAICFLEKALEFRKSESLLDISFLLNGLLEWVRDGSNINGGLGKPRPEILRNTFNPDIDEPIAPACELGYALYTIRLIKRKSCNKRRGVS